MSRKLNNVKLEDGASCMHCEVPFDRPYERMPERESPGNLVLKCQHCGYFTIFTDTDFHESQITSHESREPGEEG